MEAAGFQIPKKLCQLFAGILIHCESSVVPLSLWNSYKDVLFEHYARRMSQAQMEQATLALTLVLLLENVVSLSQIIIFLR